MIGAVIQARMGSTRLPGKVLLTLQGKTVLGHVLERVGRCRRLDRIVVATSDLPIDRQVVEEARRHGAEVFCGDEQDVLSRYAGAAEAFGLETVLRVTSDCPLIDPALLDELIAVFDALSPHCAYVCNNLPRTYPHGLDAEIFSKAALDEAHREATLPAEREHVTPYLREQPQRYGVRGLTQGVDESRFRITLDTPDDWRVIERVFGALYPAHPSFGHGDVVRFLSQPP